MMPCALCHLVVVLYTASEFVTEVAVSSILLRGRRCGEEPTIKYVNTTMDLWAQRYLASLLEHPETVVEGMV
jgi:hypothetical protein